MLFKIECTSTVAIDDLASVIYFYEQGETQSGIANAKIKAVSGDEYTLAGIPMSLNTLTLDHSSVTVEGSKAATANNVKVTPTLTSTGGSSIALSNTSFAITKGDDSFNWYSDGTITVPDNAEEGEYTVTATASAEGFTGSATAKLTVTRAAEQLTVTLSSDAATLAIPESGSAEYTPFTVASVANQFGETKTDYTVTWSIPTAVSGVALTDAATGKISVASTVADGATVKLRATATSGNVTGYADGVATLRTLETLGEGTITLNVTDKIYDGTAIADPSYSYDTYDPGSGVTANVSYTYAKKTGDTYEAPTADKPIDAGTYRVTMTYTDNYAHNSYPGSSFTTSEEVTISPKTVTVTWDGLTDKTYNGSAQDAPTASVTSGVVSGETVTATVALSQKESGPALVNGTAVKAGDYTATATLSSANYTATNLTETFTIAKKDVDTSDFVVTYPKTGDENKVEYDGQAHKATAAAADGVTGLGTITVKHYKDAAEVTNPTDIGAYTVKVAIAAGDNYNAYTETQTGSFEITKKAPTMTVSIANWTYGASAPTPVVTYNSATYDGDVTYSYVGTGNTSYTASPNAPTAAGSYKLTATVAEQGNYSEGTADTTFTVYAKSLTADMITLSADSFTYSGSEQKPTVTVTDGTTLTDGTDYDVAITGDKLSSDQKSIDVGTYTMTLTGKGNYQGSPTKTFSITKADQAALTITTTSATFGTDLTLATSGGTGDGAVTYRICSTASDGTTEPTGAADISCATLTPTKAGTVYVKATKAGDDNHNAVDSAVTAVTIGKKTVTLTAANQIILSSTALGGTSVSRNYEFTLADIVSGTGFDASNAGTVTYTYSAKSDGISATPTITGGKLAFTVPNAKTSSNYETVTLAFKSDNYEADNFTVKFVYTDKKDVSAALSVGDVSITYGDAMPTPTSTLDSSNSAAGTAANGSWTYSYAVDDSVTGNTASMTAGVTAGVPSYAGTYIITATYTDNVVDGGIPGHVGTKTAKLTIAPKTVTLTWSTESLTYNGLAQGKTVTQFGGMVGSETGLGVTYEYAGSGTTTYTASPTAPTAAGSYTVTATALTDGGTAVASNYQLPSSSSTGFTISPKTLDGSNIADIDAVTYNHAAHTPALTITDGTHTLVKDTDYTVTYSNNTNAGTATATVSFQGNYSGTTSKTFTINPRELTASNITAVAGATYSGAAQEPALTIKDGDYTLTAGTDYTVAYSNNTNAYTDGNYAAANPPTATVTFTGNYTGTAEKKFPINRKPLTASNIAVAEATYTGAPLTPALTITDGDYTLVLGTDYTVVYSNNVNAGTGTASVTFDGNYYGTATKDFTIAKPSINGATVTVGELTYTGEAQAPSIIVSLGEATIDSTEYDVTVAAQTGGTGLAGTGDNANKVINAGGYTVTVTAKTDGNYSGSASQDFAVASKPLASSGVLATGVTVDAAEANYTGSALTPTLTITDGAYTLVKDTDYTVTYSNNTNAGTGTASVSFTGNYTGTYAKSFTIGQASIASATLTVTGTYTYNGSIQEPTITVSLTGGTTVMLTANTDYVASYEATSGGSLSEGKPVGAGNYTVSVTGQGNYTGSPSTQTFTIAQKSLASSDVSVALSASSFEYSGVAQEPTVTVTDNGLPRTMSSKVLDSAAYTTLIGTTANDTESKDHAAIGTYYVIVTAASGGNYTGTTSKSYGITAKAVSDSAPNGVSIADIGDQTYTGDELKPALTITDGSSVLTEGTDYSVAYSGNISLGTTTVTVTFTGNYSGTMTKTFQIVGASIAGATVALTGAYTYTGSAITPSVTVTLNPGTENSKTLSGATDYDLVYETTNGTLVSGKPVGAGDYTVKATGKGNYSGTTTAGATLTVAKADNTLAVTSEAASVKAGTGSTLDISSMVVSGSGIGAVTYAIKDGTNSEGLFSLSGGVLTAPTDYAAGKSVTVEVTATPTGDDAKNYNVGTKEIVVTLADKDVVTLSAANQTVIYTGSVIEYSGEVKKGSETVTEGLTYTYTAGPDSLHTAAGTYTVTVKYDQGTETGTATATLTIKPKSIAGATITVADAEYTGSALKPVPTVSLEGYDISSAYDVSYENNTNAGIATVKITAKSAATNYTGSASKNFKITPKTVDSVYEITLADSSFTYDSTAKTPAVSSVKLISGGSAVDPSNYTVSYMNNVNAGSAAAVVTFKGNYANGKVGTTTRTFTKDFTIAAATVTAPTAIDGLTYTGAAQQLIKAGSAVDELEYSLASDGTYGAAGSIVGTNKGSYTVYYRVKDADARKNYASSGSSSITATIAPATLTSTNVSLSSYSGVTGTAALPTVTVTFNGTTLTAGTDYTAIWSPSTVDNSNPATYTVTVNGVSGSNFATASNATAEYGVAAHEHNWVYTATGAQITASCDVTGCTEAAKTLTISAAGGVYDGTAKTATVTGTLPADVTISYADANGSTVDTAINAGSYTAKATAGGATATKNYTITPIALSDTTANVTLGSDSATLKQGKANLPTITVTANGKTLTRGTDYTIEWNPATVTAAGDYTATVTGKGNYTSTITKTFTVNAAPTYSINVTDYSEGAITVKKGSTVVNSAEEGEIITLQTTATDGFALVNGSLAVKKAGGEEVTVKYDSTNETYSFMMPAEAVTVTANFEKVFSGTVDAATEAAQPAAAELDSGAYADTGASSAAELNAVTQQIDDFAANADTNKADIGKDSSDLTNLAGDVAETASEAVTENQAQELLDQLEYNEGEEPVLEVVTKPVFDVSYTGFKTSGIEAGTSVAVITQMSINVTAMMESMLREKGTIGGPTVDLGRQAVDLKGKKIDLRLPVPVGFGGSTATAGSTVYVTHEDGRRTVGTLGADWFVTILNYAFGFSGINLSIEPTSVAQHDTYFYDDFQEAVDAAFAAGGSQTITMVKGGDSGSYAATVSATLGDVGKSITIANESGNTATASISSSNDDFVVVTSGKTHTVTKTLNSVKVLVNKKDGGTTTAQSDTVVTISFTANGAERNVQATTDASGIATFTDEHIPVGTTASATISGRAGSATIEESTPNNATITVDVTTSSGGGAAPATNVKAVSGVKNGSVKFSTTNAKAGDKVTVTATPNQGYKVASVTVKDSKGNDVAVTENADGTFSFTMPSGAVTVTPVFEKADKSLSRFIDVDENAFYAKAVEWAVSNGITDGVSDTEFAPNDGCTRAQAVTFLYRAAGAPEAAVSASFQDVAADSYYAKAVAWAVANGITNGMSDTEFAPDAICTRAQIVTFLSRYEKAAATSGNKFADVSADAYYAGAVGWAVANGITNGVSDTEFAPDAVCTRAHIVTFLYRDFVK